LVDRLGGCHPIKLYSTSTAVNQWIMFVNLLLVHIYICFHALFWVFLNQGRNKGKEQERNRRTNWGERTTGLAGEQLHAR
jgi:hypothetical protein